MRCVGSESATTPNFLDAVSPTIVIVPSWPLAANAYPSSKGDAVIAGADGNRSQNFARSRIADDHHFVLADRIQPSFFRAERQSVGLSHGAIE